MISEKVRKYIEACLKLTNDKILDCRQINPEMTLIVMSDCRDSFNGYLPHNLYVPTDKEDDLLFFANFFFNSSYKALTIEHFEK